MVFAPTVLFLLLSFLSPGDCADCSYTPKRTELCSSHDAEERKVLAAAKREYDQGGPAARQRILGEVAELTGDHANAPSLAVAKFLANGLEDKEIEVRSESAKRLLLGQHPDTTAKSLVEAWRGADKKYRKYLSDLKLTAKNKDKFTKKSTAIFSRVMDFPLELRHAADLLAALGALPDKRCESELIKVLGAPVQKANAILAVTAAGGLLSLDSHDGVQAVIDFQSDLASMLGSKKREPRYPISDPLAFLDWVMVHDRELNESDFELVAQALAKAAEAKGVRAFPARGPKTQRSGRSGLSATERRTGIHSQPQFPSRIVSPSPRSAERTSPPDRTRGEVWIGKDVLHPASLPQQDASTAFGRVLVPRA